MLEVTGKLPAEKGVRSSGRKSPLRIERYKLRDGKAMPNLEMLQSVLSRSTRWMLGFLPLFWRRNQNGNLLSSALQEMGKELDLLTKSTEDDFLLMGEMLQKFYERSSVMAGISASVGRLMTGEEMEAIGEGFRRLVGRIETLESDSRRSAEMLRHLLGIRSQLCSRLSGFQQTIRSLRVLGVSTRIESARLGERDIGFSILADEVGKLAQEIEDKCSHLSARAESLGVLIDQTLGKVSDIEANRHAQGLLILGNTMSNLRSLTERHELSAKCAADVSNRYEAVTRSIGEIVTSLQFHDITRQRIEHARDALVAVADGERTGGKSGHRGENSGDNPGSEDGNGDKSCPVSGAAQTWGSTDKASERQSLCGDICTLQIAQLGSARNVMVSAVENIVAHLRKVANAVKDAAEETREMAGAADKAERSFLAEVEAGLTSVVSTFSAYAETGRDLSKVIGSVSDTLSDMSAHTGEIKAIGEKTKLIALNAIVKASHIGDEGVTLSVLAEAIHRLSIETRRQTDTVTDALRSMTLESEALTGGVGAGGEGGAADASSLEQELKALLGSLGSLERDIEALLGRVNEEGATLAEDILSALEKVQVHHRVDGAISGVVARLQGIVSSIGPLNSTGSPSGVTANIQALEASYTMKEERDVHRSLAEALDASGNGNVPGLAAPPEKTGTDGTPETSSEEGSSEDLGDNIELF